MLYGNLIFIKKTGGDGSKFPVTEREVKIGRSENCLIRIHNSDVAPEHCHLIVEENGQTTLRNLCNRTALNGKLLSEGDVTLCHGDIFKIGERLARWEYLPTSKYYRQLLSPSGHLVAVVMPQKRSMGKQSTPGNSALKVSVLKNTPLQKRRYSERDSTVRVRKSSGTDLICKAKGDLSKFLIGRHSVKTTKLLLNGAKVKERKSISGTLSSNITKRKCGGKSRKSTLPSWKVNIVSPSQQKSTSRNSVTKSSKKLVKSPKSTVKRQLKDILDSEFSQTLCLPVSKSTLKTPQFSMDLGSCGGLAKSASKSLSETPLKTMVESPSLKGERSVRSTGSFSKSPSPKKNSPKSLSKIVLSTPKPKPPKFARLAHSESKLNSTVGRQDLFPDRSERMDLILEKIDSVPAGNLKKLRKSVIQENAKVSECIVSHGVTENSVRRTLLKEASPMKRKQTRKSVKGTPAKNISGKTGRSSRENLLPESPGVVTVKTPRKSVMKKTPGSLKRETFRVSTSGEVPKTPLPNDVNFASSSNKAKHTPRKSAKSTSIKKTGKLVGSTGKMKLSTSPGGKTSVGQNETISLASPLGISLQESGMKEASVKKMASSSKVSKSSPRGVRRKLSPTSSAERAAKKLKTSSPKKPDKNKKAALLVLGKANRKQLPSQNVKVLLKQKIVKKAIKQSTVLTSQKVESRTKITAKLKKGLRKTALKSKKTSTGEEKSLDRILPSGNSKASDASTIQSPAKDKVQEITPKDNALLETSELIAFKAQASPTLSSKGKVIETPEKSTSKQSKKSESPRSIPSPKSSTSTSSPSDKLYKTTESYLFSSNRRSKRLSSKNETDRPDFIELSPTALGLIPKNVSVFKTPKDSKRRSSSLVTPKNIQSIGIIKSASTSKIGNRKSVRFFSKGVSYNSELQRLVVAEKVDLDFSSYNTPDVTIDIFVSPLADKSVTNKGGSESLSTSATGDVSKTSAPRVRRSSSGSNTCVQKLLQSPQARSSPLTESLSQNSRIPAIKSASPYKRERKLKSVREYKSPKNDLSDLEGVCQLFGTPKAQKSPKNDLTDVKGTKQLFRTPKTQKSPKNDLTDVKGIKKLFRTPKTQKSPKNDLTDVRGVKKLMQTPKVQRSPKNDLTDVRGVKKLMQTPKAQRSPKNDLTDVRGVKKLMQTPKVQRSPKNDLTDVRGVKKLMQTPKAQRSPKNDLTDVRGVKKLMQTPKVQRSPKNDLTNVYGVKELLRSPRVQKSPKNDLSDLRGIKKLFESSKVQRSPKNDLTDVTGVKKLLTTPRDQKSPKNYLLEISGLGNLFDSPAVEEISNNAAVDLMKVPVNSPKTEGNSIPSAADVSGVAFISKSSESVSKSKKTVSRKPHVNEYKAIRGRGTIYSTPKGPKNDLSDLTGVRELFSRHKPTSEYVSLTGVAELFDLPDSDVDSKPKKGKSIQYTTRRKPPSKRPPECENELEIEVKKEDTPVTRRRILRKGIEDESRKRATRRKAAENVEEEKPVKRRAVKKTSETKKTPAKKSEKVTKKETKTMGKKSQARIESSSSELVKEEVKRSRKRKVLFEEDETPPVKTTRKLIAAEAASSVETPRRTSSRSKKEKVSEEKVSVKGVKRDLAEQKRTKTSKTSSKAVNTSTKLVLKVQNRSQKSSDTNSIDSEARLSPRKTRSAKSGASKTNEKKIAETVEKKVAKVTAGKRNKSPAVKRSTRRK